jgi:hypothetical protein
MLIHGSDQITINIIKNLKTLLAVENSQRFSRMAPLLICCIEEFLLPNEIYYFPI